MAARRLGSPASRWLRPSALLLLVASALLSAPSPARALRFDLESGHTKCVSDEIKVNAMAVGKYHIVGPDPNSPDAQLPESHRISLRVTSPYGNSMHYAENVQSGHFAFTAAEAGDYLACFWAPDHKPPVTIGFEFDWRSGVSAKDYPSVAKKGKVDEMQVDTEPFPMNMIDFEGKKVLVRPNTADKGKETIIGNAKEADGDRKVSCRKVVAEKTPDGGETLKVTITASSTGGQAQTGRQMQEPVLRIPDGPARRRGRSGTPPDGPESSGGRSGHTQDSQRPRTFKPRRPEIDDGIGAEEARGNYKKYT
uniref:GOLD domain-containing protein n=1 Tax=Zea mays TaxID=4577 RepID=B4FLJ1_MAIZE|nr:unknown [Zea mays]